VKRKDHAEPVLQEVHEWREKVFEEIKSLSPKEKIRHLNEKAAKARKEFEKRQKKPKAG